MIKFFKKYPEIFAIMSEKEDGTMRLFNNGNINKKNEENRKKYFKKIGVSFKNVLSAYLINGTNVEIVEGNKKKIIPKTDALITKSKNVYLSVSAADCIPVLFYDPASKIIGIAHAGWRGTVDAIVEKTLVKMIKIGANSKNIAVALGPGINKCHFEVKKDVLDKFNNYRKFIKEKDKRFFVDLKGIIKKQLLDFGIKEKNIENNNDCTFCNETRYFSNRREKKKDVGLMINLIGRIK